MRLPIPSRLAASLTVALVIGLASTAVSASLAQNNARLTDRDTLLNSNSERGRAVCLDCTLASRRVDLD
jgi:hypothetical protein